MSISLKRLNNELESRIKRLKGDKMEISKLAKLNTEVEKRMKKMSVSEPSKAIIYKGHKIQVQQGPDYLWLFLIDGKKGIGRWAEYFEAEEEAKHSIDKGWVEEKGKKMSAYKQQVHTKSGKVIGYDVVQKGSSYYPMVDGVTSWNQSFEDPEDALMKAREIATNYFGP